MTIREEPVGVSGHKETSDGLVDRDRATILEVIVTSPEEAVAAQSGGATRLELVASPERGGLTPSPAMTRAVLAATDLPVRVMIRQSESHVTSPQIVAALTAEVDALVDAGAQAFVAGLLTDDRQVAAQALGTLLPRLAEHRWTFHRALDECVNLGAGVDAALALPGCDAALVAGDPRGVAYGTTELVQLLRDRPEQSPPILIGGGLRTEHLAALVDVGARAIHVGRSVRTGGTWDGSVDAQAVRAIGAQVADLIGRKVAS